MISKRLGTCFRDGGEYLYLIRSCSGEFYDGWAQVSWGSGKGGRVFGKLEWCVVSVSGQWFGVTKLWNRKFDTLLMEVWGKYPDGDGGLFHRGLGMEHLHLFIGEFEWAWTKLACEWKEAWYWLGEHRDNYSLWPLALQASFSCPIAYFWNNQRPWGALLQNLLFAILGKKWFLHMGPGS